MSKRSNIIFATIAVLSLTGSQAQINNCSQESNCTGYYYEDINAAFVDCLDMNGVLVSRKENFYTSPLQKECNSTNYDDFLVEAGRTTGFVPGPKTVDFCDYFEIGVGYQFTQADDGIGLVVLEDRVGGARDLFYKNLMQQPGVLYWDWQELGSLVQAYASAQCSSSNSSSNSSDQGGEIWQSLDLPWASWNITAQHGFNISVWTKAEWKEWILWYVEYYNALQIKLAAPVVNATMPSNSSESSASGSGSSSNETAVVLLNFTAIWLPKYDLSSITVAKVVADLNASSSIIINTTSWFHLFFGPKGLVTLNITLSMQQSNLTVNTSFGINIPVGLEAIVAWITMEVKEEINMICPTCNFGQVNNSNNSNSTIGTNTTIIIVTNQTNTSISTNTTTTNITTITNVTTITNTTTTNITTTTNTTISSNTTITTNISGSGSSSNSTNVTIVTNTTISTNSSNSSVGFFNSGNYSLPSSCSIVSGSNNQQVNCFQSVLREVTYTFSELNEFYDFQLDETCINAQSQYAQCLTNSVITDIDICFRLSFYNTFQLDLDTVIYGWLYFDIVSQQVIYNKCSELSNFSLTQAQFTAGFQFEFGNLM